MRRAIVFSCLCLVLTGCPAKELDLGEGQDGGTGSGDCTVGEDQTCNADPTVSALWGTCQPDGTCVCNDGFSVDPTSGKCVSDATDGGAAPVCVYGQDQTCNPDPTISALWGTCQPDGTCVCNDGFTVDPTTGKCMVDAIDGGAAPVCTYGQDQTCNPDPTISALYGTCQPDGTCLCNDGFAVDPTTGKCMVDAIDGGAAPACVYGQDQTCNPDPTISALWGTCQPDGTCLCNDGFTVDPTTGKCMEGAIDGGAP